MTLTLTFTFYSTYFSTLSSSMFNFCELKNMRWLKKKGKKVNTLCLCLPASSIHYLFWWVRSLFRPWRRHCGCHPNPLSSYKYRLILLIPCLRKVTCHPAQGQILINWWHLSGMGLEWSCDLFLASEMLGCVCVHVCVLSAGAQISVKKINKKHLQKTSLPLPLDTVTIWVNDSRFEPVRRVSL